MNRGQKKKFWKNHLLMENTITGKRYIVKVKDFIELARIAELTEDELKKILNVEE